MCNALPSSSAMATGFSEIQLVPSLDLGVPHHAMVFQVGKSEFVFISHLNPAGVPVGVSELSTGAGCVIVGIEESLLRG